MSLIPVQVPHESRSARNVAAGRKVLVGLKTASSTSEALAPSQCWKPKVRYQNGLSKVAHFPRPDAERRGHTMIIHNRSLSWTRNPSARSSPQETAVFAMPSTLMVVAPARRNAVRRPRALSSKSSCAASNDCSSRSVAHIVSVCPRGGKGSVFFFPLATTAVVTNREGNNKKKEDRCSDRGLGRIQAWKLKLIVPTSRTRLEEENRRLRAELLRLQSRCISPSLA